MGSVGGRAAAAGSAGRNQGQSLGQPIRGLSQVPQAAVVMKRGIVTNRQVIINVITGDKGDKGNARTKKHHVYILAS